MVNCHFRIFQCVRCLEFHRVQSDLKTSCFVSFHLVQVPFSSVRSCWWIEYPSEIDSCP